MKTMKLFALLLLTSTANAATWYVSPTGNDGNTGTLAEPFLTIQKGHDVAVAGDTIYVRGGTYESATEVTITRDGVSGNPIRLLAYPNERPIIDGINLTNNGSSDILRGKPLRLLGASWWVIDGFEIKRGSSGGIIISQASNNNIIRRLDVHHNGRLATHSGTGVMLHDRSGNNLIENSDSHNNRDDQGTSPGGDADGFATVLVGSGNVLRNNRAWQNSDDGYDAFNGTNGVAFEGNFAFENGYNESLGNAGGNGDGFKLGGQKTGFFSGSNIVTNNLSWRNKQHGFDGNGANTPNTIINNTAWLNGNTNFIFTVAVADVLRNNLTFTGRIARHAVVDDEFNSWNLPITINAADFESLVDTIARGPRRSDGTLPASGFLHLATESYLIDQGTDVGLPYSGTAPDLGAYEALPLPSGLPTVTVVATDPTATEAGVTTGTVVVSRTGSTAAALTVNYTVSGAATPGSDYTALTGSVTIPAAAASATITVTPIDDTAVEPNEIVVVSLSPDGTYVVGAPGSATVTIVSDDVAPPDKDLVTEGLALSAGSVAAGSSVTTSYRVANRGTTKVTETYTEKLYLSTNATLDAGDVLLGTSHGHTNDLALNATHAHLQVVTVPAGTAAGSYFLVVQADSLAAVTETNEGNNITAVTLTVTAP